MFHEIKFKPHACATTLPPTGVTTDDDDGPPFVCVLCPDGGASFPHKRKLLIHYVLNHRQPYCSTCCTVLATEMERMTHENKTHWPFRCTMICRAEFFQATRLQEHVRIAHGQRTCDLCEATLCTADGDDEYEQHLRLQHDCVSSDFDLDIAAPVVPSAGAAGVAVPRSKVISKFSCRLCAKEKLFVNFHGHFLNHHKVRLNKFLALTLQFMNSNEEFLSRIGPSEKSARGGDVTLPMSAVAARPKAAFADFADNFEVAKRDNATEGGAAESKLDFDTSLVQFVASTDNDSTTDDDDDDGGSSRIAERGPSKVRRLGCPYCETSVVFDRVALGKHLHTVHGFQVRNLEYRCHRCRRGFASRLSLRRHRQKVHALDANAEEPSGSRRCSFCEQVLGGRRALRTHIRQHVDRHDYPCPPDQLAHCCRFCTERFWTVDQKNSHQKARHTLQMPNAELMLCGHCGITSSSKSFLGVHTSEAHATLSQLATFVYKCAACLIAHSSLADLRSHMLLVHPGSVAEYCSIDDCRARVVDTTALELHLRTQHGDLFEYTCKACGHRLLSKQGALKHYLVKHGA